MKKLSSIAAFYVIIVMTLFAVTVPLHAQPGPQPGPQPGFMLHAITDNGEVHLQWERPPMTLSTPFSIYRITIQSDAFATSSPILRGDTLLLGTTTDTVYVDTPPHDRNFFAYFIEAKTTGDSTVQSSIAFVFIRGENTTDKVRIISTPVITAQVGVQYIYDVNAVSSDSTAVIRYRQTTIFNSVHIQCDSVTGIITMIPAAKQIIPIEVIAQSNKGGYATQEFEVKVSGTNGTISGTVTDTLGLPIKKVLINVLKRDARMPFFYSTITDSLGKYRITGLDRGTYLVHAIPLDNEYQDQWYDGKSSSSDATPIILDSIATVDFKLRNKIVPHLFTVQGIVLDTLGLPLPVHGTNVFFVDADFALNTNNVRQNIDFNHDIDFRMEGGSRFVFKTGVDSQGSYSLRLPAGQYIAFAQAPGYITEFFKDKSTYLEADIIKLTADSSGIDFTLTPLPAVSSGSISGQVLDTVNNVGVRSRMIAYRGVMTFAPVKGHSIPSFFTETDSLGSYDFTNLPPGLYIILAIPVGNYAPVFYNDGTEGIQWSKATRITINGNSVSGINLYPHTLPDSTRGYTMIRGSVKNSDNGNAPIGGAFVYASNEDGSLAGYAVTDAQGSFVIDELAPGSYTVSSDIAGYNALTSAPASPSYDAQGKAVIATVSLNLQTVTSIESGTTVTQPTTYILSQNYPNPFNPSTRISFTIPSRSQVTLKVYNVIGQEVATLVNSTYNAGKYTVDFNASYLSTGVYFYRIKAGDFSSTMKMILIK